QGTIAQGVMASRPPLRRPPAGHRWPRAAVLPAASPLAAGGRRGRLGGRLCARGAALGEHALEVGGEALEAAAHLGALLLPRRGAAVAGRLAELRELLLEPPVLLPQPSDLGHRLA